MSTRARVAALVASVALAVLGPVASPAHAALTATTINSAAGVQPEVTTSGGGSSNPSSPGSAVSPGDGTNRQLPVPGPFVWFPVLVAAGAAFVIRTFTRPISGRKSNDR